MSSLNSLRWRFTSRVHSTHDTVLTLPREMNLLSGALLMSEEGLTVQTCEDVSHNELVHKLTESKCDQVRPPHPRDMAAANRTLSCDKTLPILMNSDKHHFQSGFARPLQTENVRRLKNVCLQNIDRSRQQLQHTFVHQIQKSFIRFFPPQSCGSNNSAL